MNRTVLALLVAAPLAAACAASSRSLSAPPAASRASPATGTRERMLCQAEKPVGSNMARMVYRTQEQIDAESQAAQDAIHLMPSGETIRA